MHLGDLSYSVARSVNDVTVSFGHRARRLQRKGPIRSHASTSPYLEGLPSSRYHLIFFVVVLPPCSLGTVLGSTIWHSFLAGPLAYSHLPRQQFGNLQSKLFPPFFALQSAGSLALLALYKRAGHVLSRHDSTSWVLGGMSLAGLLNLLLVGPWTTSIMFRRHRVERLENTTYSAPDPSSKMKSLNRRFAIAHSVSSLLNLGFVFAVVGHAAWIAQNGLTMV